jgi:hypothetical protein
MTGPALGQIPVSSSLHGAYDWWMTQRVKPTKYVHMYNVNYKCTGLCDNRRAGKSGIS